MQSETENISAGALSTRGRDIHFCRHDTNSLYKRALEKNMTDEILWEYWRTINTEQYCTNWTYL